MSTLRQAMESREGVAQTDAAIQCGLCAWGVRRHRPGCAPKYGETLTAIVFGRCRSDAVRRASAPARLGEEFHADTTEAREIRSGWDEPIVWPFDAEQVAL